MFEHFALSFVMICRLQDKYNLDEHLLVHAMDLNLAPVQTAGHAGGTQGPRVSGMKVLLLS